MTHRTCNRTLLSIPGGASDANRLNRRPLELLGLSQEERAVALRAIEREARAHDATTTDAQRSWREAGTRVHSPLHVARVVAAGR